MKKANLHSLHVPSANKIQKQSQNGSPPQIFHVKFIHISVFQHSDANYDVHKLLFFIQGYQYENSLSNMQGCKLFKGTEEKYFILFEILHLKLETK